MGDQVSSVCSYWHIASEACQWHDTMAATKAWKLVTTNIYRINDAPVRWNSANIRGMIHHSQK